MSVDIHDRRYNRITYTHVDDAIFHGVDISKLVVAVDPLEKYGRLWPIVSTDSMTKIAPKKNLLAMVPVSYLSGVGQK
jgi:hypothetical protein